MKMKKVLAALLAAGCLLTGLAGCSVTTSKPLSMDVTQALEDYAEENLRFAEEQMDGSGVNLEITVDGNSLIYTYTNETQMDNSDGSVTSQLDAAAESNADSFQSVVDQIAQDINQQDIQLKVVYLNADGTELGSYSYSSAD
ncbi:MAG TPA: DUF4854 domain-containing protein [Candidatus Egerieicola faecale]|uniref:DUF4854 domain-containing protein n=1 Tax=Candidatus Egerieicola faecale TaxID=2840774 RepID=A0A9D1IT50_9FIRM|nr:DUF4854 domain-containing protein [Candidatus Egerieicola faecale]